MRGYHWTERWPVFVPPRRYRNHPALDGFKPPQGKGNPATKQTHRHASVSSNELWQIGTCGMSHSSFHGWKQTQPQLKTCHRKMQILLGFALGPRDRKRSPRFKKKRNFLFLNKHRHLNPEQPHTNDVPPQQCSNLNFGFITQGSTQWLMFPERGTINKP